MSEMLWYVGSESNSYIRPLFSETFVTVIQVPGKCNVAYNSSGAVRLSTQLKWPYGNTSEIRLCNYTIRSVRCVYLRDIGLTSSVQLRSVFVTLRVMVQNSLHTLTHIRVTITKWNTSGFRSLMFGIYLCILSRIWGIVRCYWERSHVQSGVPGIMECCVETYFDIRLQVLTGIWSSSRK